MTIIDAGNGTYYGLSSDTKGTSGIAAGSLFIETDTRNIFAWNTIFSKWQRIHSPYYPSSGRYSGRRPGSGTTNANSGDGLFIGCIQGSNGTFASGATSTDGWRGNHASGATASNRAGWLCAGGSSITMRFFNPRLKFRFRLNQANSANNRLYFGFIDTTQPAAATPMGDTFCDGKHAFCLGYRTTDTGWMIIHNNATATATYDAAGLPAIDTNAHTFEVWASDSAPNFQWSFDGGAVNTVSTTIPSSTQPLFVYMILETTTTTSYSFFERYTEIDHDVI